MPQEDDRAPTGWEALEKHVASGDAAPASGPSGKTGWEALEKHVASGDAAPASGPSGKTGWEALEKHVSSEPGGGSATQKAPPGRGGRWSRPSGRDAWVWEDPRTLLTFLVMIASLVVTFFVLDWPYLAALALTLGGMFVAWYVGRFVWGPDFDKAPALRWRRRGRRP